MVKFLIDTNVFIQAKNFHYQFCFCEKFWNLILDLHERNILYSVKSVFYELTKNNNKDELVNWVTNNIPESFWLDHDKAASKYIEVINWAHSQKFKEKAISDFADYDAADAWLVSYAAQFDYSIISQEKSNPYAIRKIYLADVAKEFNVPYFTIYEFLTKYTKPDFCYK
ncbi:DUF4411 family protein [Snodgrassella alvi]|jgi:hypothetical protein|uniref:DUF4411 family protein n=1 Tax=Snodgrassella alvi TaxID=1196083 RepID=UPI000CBE102C|nr:DUF4411 family protein [Snodgrassella alvi]PIT50989.1 hypothetical protein BHC51_00735 [Snodgrassella alvi]